MKTYPVRTSAKAIIFRNNHLLAMKHQKGSDIFYTLPGGGQNHNEDIHSTLIRECLEEAGVEITIKELVLVRDYIANNHQFADQDPDFHQVELMFLCDINNPENFHPQTEPDTYQIGMDWLPVQELENYRIFPLNMRKSLIQIHNKIDSPIYLGDIN